MLTIPADATAAASEAARLQAELKEHKRQQRSHRQLARARATELATLRRDCAAIGIHLVVEPRT